MGMDPTLIFCAAERRQGRDWFDYRKSMFNGLVEFAAYMLIGPVVVSTGNWSTTVGATASLTVVKVAV